MCGDAQPGGPAGHRGPGRRDHAVPVAVGLDHGHHLAAGHPGPQHVDVAADRAEVDEGLGVQVLAGARALAGPGLAGRGMLTRTGPRGTRRAGRGPRRPPRSALPPGRWLARPPPRRRRWPRGRPGPAGRHAVQEGGRGGGIGRAEALGQQRAGQAGQHVAGPGRGQPGRPGGVDPDRVGPGRVRGEQITVVEPLSRTVTPRTGGRPRVGQPLGLDVGPVGAGQPGQLAGVRGDQRGRRPRQQVAVLGQDRQPVGVDQDREVGARTAASSSADVLAGAHARAGHPGLDPAGRRQEAAAVVSCQRLPPLRMRGLGRHGDHGLGPRLPDQAPRRGRTATGPCRPRRASPRRWTSRAAPV